MTNKTTRTRNWTFVLYPESAPENWREILDDLHLEWVESPLHDSDINATGEPKKSHFHILILFKGNKTYEQVVEITSSVNSTIPQQCHNAKSLVRYMAHLDNPEKFQYSAAEIKSHGGVEIADLLKPSASEKYSIIKEIIIHLQDNRITEFQDLVDYALAERYDDWFPILCDGSTIMLSAYIKSARHRRQRVDSDTGEILD